jgi:hypothetical protein
VAREGTELSVETLPFTAFGRTVNRVTRAVTHIFCAPNRLLNPRPQAKLQIEFWYPFYLSSSTPYACCGEWVAPMDPQIEF